MCRRASGGGRGCRARGGPSVQRIHGSNCRRPQSIVASQPEVASSCSGCGRSRKHKPRPKQSRLDSVTEEDAGHTLLPDQGDPPTLAHPPSRSSGAVLGASNNTRKPTGFSSNPTSYKTNHNRIPVTKPNQVSWADRVRGNNTKDELLPDTTRTGYFDTIGKYASNLIRLS